MPNEEITELQSDVEITPREDRQDVGSIVDIEEKEKEILKKKRKFKLLLIISIISILIIILIPISINFYKNNLIKSKPIVQEVTEEERRLKEEEVEANKIVQYDSSALKLTLEYPKEAILTEETKEDLQIKKLEIAFDKQNGQEVITSENLKEGYIFKVSTFATSQRNIDEITQVKKDAFVSQCPQTATVSKTTGINIDGVEGRTFEVINCELDFKLTYLVKNEINYEIAQTYKGDVGYKQVYKAETEDIFNSIKFYVEVAEDTPTETFRSDNFGFSFEHPKFISDCCDMTSPISGKSTWITVLGDSENIVDRNNYDGIGIFVDETHNRIDFNTYLEEQKNILMDDYVVVKGETPKPEDISIKVGDRDAVMLKGYSWRGDILVYLDITKKGDNNKYLIISIRNTSGETFEKKVNEILKSFKFF